MKKIIYIGLVIVIMLTVTGCGKQKKLGELCNLIVKGDDLAIEKIEKLKNVNEYVRYSYIDPLDEVILDGDKGECISLLSLACAVGNEDAINTLLEKGANPGGELKEGARAYPLEYFCQSGYASGSYLLEKLIDAGGDIDRYEMEAPVFRLAENLKVDSENVETLMEEIWIIIDGGGSWNSKSLRHDGDNLMHVAATIEDGELLETLMEYDEGSEYINARDAFGSTPLMSAVNAGCWNNVAGLIVHGVDTQLTDNSGMTARELAVSTGNKIIIKIFDMAEGLQ